MTRLLSPSFVQTIMADLADLNERLGDFPVTDDDSYEISQAELMTRNLIGALGDLEAHL